MDKRIYKCDLLHIAICGLDCNSCDIFKVTWDSVKAKPITDLFKKETDVDVKLADIGCLGCRGIRSKHWSADCWILKCCVDDHKLEYCFQCNEFPCKKLIDWSKERESYRMALDRLKRMHQNDLKE